MLGLLADFGWRLLPAACSAQLAFGEGSAALKEGRNATVQGLSGTGSLRVRGWQRQQQLLHELKCG